MISYSKKKELMRTDIAHEIQQIFMYQYKDREVDQSFINSHSRIWISVFNELVKMGLIYKRRTRTGYKYRWVGKLPDI